VSFDSLRSDRDRLGETARDLAAIWREVLRKPDVGLDEDFFDAGGHSMAFLRVGALIRQRLGVDVTLLRLLTHPTIASLAEDLVRTSETR
jgi:acyl carrier protein